MMFSVIVPTHNRAGSLRRTVESLLRQTFTDHEIIIVNDGSTDGTAAYLAELPSGRNIIPINQSNRGPAAARNAGLKKAQGTFVVFTDDDCIVPPDWLALFAGAIKRTEADIIGGSVRNCVPRNLFSEVSQEITNYFVEVAGSNSTSTTFLTTNNIAYKKVTLLNAGGFDERFRRAGGEERALHARIVANGGRSLFVRDITIEHYNFLTLAGFFGQQCNYGRGSYLLYRMTGKELPVAPRMIPVSAYLRLLLYFFSSGIFTGIIKAVLYLLAQLAVLFGFILQMFSAEKKGYS